MVRVSTKSNARNDLHEMDHEDADDDDVDDHSHRDEGTCMNTYSS